MPVDPESFEAIRAPYIPNEGIPDAALIIVTVTTENPDDIVQIGELEIKACNTPGKYLLVVRHGLCI